MSGTEAVVSDEQRTPRQLNVFFDVDNTLIMWDGVVRNHIREVFEALKENGHEIYIWSGVGIALIALVGWLILGQKLDLPAIAGIGLIASGVMVISLFSGSVPE